MNPLTPLTTPIPWYQSTAIWIQIFTAVAAIATALLGTDLVKQNPKATMIIGAVIAIANVLIRLDTSKAIQGTSKATAIETTSREQ